MTNNKTIIIFLIITIITSLMSSVLIISKLKNFPKGFTGMVDTDTGDISIQIADVIIISLDVVNSSIDFGTCTIPKNSTVSITSGMQPTYIDQNTEINCTGSNLPAHLSLLNLGNVEVNLTIQTNKIASGTNGLLRSDNASIGFYARNATNFGCIDKYVNIVDSTKSMWQTFLVANQEYIACEHMATGDPHPTINVWLNLTIPIDANTGGAKDTAILTFWASKFN